MESEILHMTDSESSQLLRSESRRLTEAIGRVTDLINRNPESVEIIKDKLNNLYKALTPTRPNDYPVSPDVIPGDRRRVENRLRGFNPRDSAAWKAICGRFGPALNQSELLSIAEVIGAQVGIKIDREAKRRKEVLIKWYDENADALLPYINFIVLEDNEGRLVGKRTTSRKYSYF